MTEEIRTLQDVRPRDVALRSSQAECPYCASNLRPSVGARETTYRGQSLTLPWIFSRCNFCNRPSMSAREMMFNASRFSAIRGNVDDFLKGEVVQAS